MKPQSCKALLPGLLLVMASGVAADARAQSGPFTGIFGATRDAANPASQVFSGVATVVEAYDSNLLAEQSGGRPSALTASGSYTMLQSDLRYAWQGRRAEFGASWGSVLRHYNQFDVLSNVSQSAGIGLSVRLANPTTLSVSQTAAYAPSYLSALFPLTQERALGESVPTAANYATNDSDSLSYGSKLVLSQKVSRRGTVSVAAEYNANDVLRETAEYGDTRFASTRAEYSQNVTRRVGLVAGYRFRNGSFGFVAGSNAVEHGLDVGVNYAKRLSASRQATVRVRLGASSIQIEDTLLATSRDNLTGLSGEEFQGTGEVGVGYQFDRTWQTNVSYRRSLEYVAELSKPVMTDGVAATVEGMFTRRVDFLAGGGYSRGVSAASRTPEPFESYTAAGRLRVGLTPRLATYIEYVYYYYDFFGAAVLVAGVPSQLERSGIRGGLSILLPTLGR